MSGARMLLPLKIQLWSKDTTRMAMISLAVQITLRCVASSSEKIISNLPMEATFQLTTTLRRNLTNALLVLDIHSQINAYTIELTNTECSRQARAYQGPRFDDDRSACVAAERCGSGVLSVSLLLSRYDL